MGELCNVIECIRDWLSHAEPKPLPSKMAIFTLPGVSKNKNGVRIPNHILRSLKSLIENCPPHSSDNGDFVDAQKMIEAIKPNILLELYGFRLYMDDKPCEYSRFTSIANKSTTTDILTAYLADNRQKIHHTNTLGGAVLALAVPTLGLMLQAVNTGSGESIVTANTSLIFTAMAVHVVAVILSIMIFIFEKISIKFSPINYKNISMKKRLKIQEERLEQSLKNEIAIKDKIKERLEKREECLIGHLENGGDSNCEVLALWKRPWLFILGIPKIAILNNIRKRLVKLNEKLDILEESLKQNGVNSNDIEGKFARHLSDTNLQKAYLNRAKNFADEINNSVAGIERVYITTHDIQIADQVTKTAYEHYIKRIITIVALIVFGVAVTIYFVAFLIGTLSC